ncbi:fructosamine kinase family protein [Flaviaesturariibacter amylovorans]|uniref:Fructosamine kinase family protein n=1 Tax=Flaviaesturariibacter amylovorans TaxID=1084520 RepID=A0ABP8HIN4_9BACT
MHPILPLLEQRLRERITDLRPVGGGSINATFAVRTASGARYFCKHNSAPKFPHLFSCEADGLKLIAEQQLIRTPRIHDMFETAADQVLLLEWIDDGTPGTAFWERFGRELAALHGCRAPQFGGTPDNYMGSVPQPNRAHPRWSDFFLGERLLPLVRRCQDAGLLPVATAAAIEGLDRHLPGLFGDPAPALLHGDLWSGNFLCAGNGDPVLIDPAVYYGHPAMDLGMTTLFGGFEPPFYAAYHEASPLPANHREQWDVANLYPLLIHLLLFGRSYLPPINETLTAYR